MIYYEAEIQLPTKDGSGTISYKVDRRNLVSLDISVSDRSDFNAPSFGIISNVGNIEFIDNNKGVSILEYAKLGLLEKNLPVLFYIVNSITKKREIQANMLSSSWGYDVESKRVSLSTKDFLEEWQEIECERAKIDVSKNFSGTAKLFYIDILAITPEKYKSGGRFFLDKATEEHLYSIKDNIGSMEGGNLWNIWNRFCKATQTHLFVDQEGKIIVKYNGGN